MLEYLSAGDSMEDLLAEFTDLEREDLLACLQVSKIQQNWKYEKNINPNTPTYLTNGLW